MGSGKLPGRVSQKSCPLVVSRQGLVSTVTVNAHWVVFPLLCLATIHASVSNTVHHLGNKPVGIRGTFVVQPRSCSQGFCSFGGLFTSDDHTIKNLPLLGDPRWHTTEVHRVTYDPKSVEVTALPGHWDPTPSVMATFGALTYLVVIGYFVRERQRRSGRSWRRVVATSA